jgi:DDE superfamily endonuclease
MLPMCRTPGDVYTLPQFDVSPSEVEGFLDELRAFHTPFRECFGRSEPRDHFFRYMVGQFSTLERKSIEPIALQADASSVRAMQRWVSDVPWDEPRMLECFTQNLIHAKSASITASATVGHSASPDNVTCWYSITLQ